MQHRIAKRELRYEKGKNYRIRELPSGALQIEIRSTEYGPDTIRMPVGTRFTVAHNKARNRLVELSTADVPEEARKVLKKFTLDELIEAYLKFTVDMHERDRQNLRTFQKYNHDTCSKTLNQHHAIVKGIEDYITNRKKDDIVEWTITRQLSPLRKMYRNAGKKRLYGLSDVGVTIKNPFLEIDLPIVPEDTSEEDKAQSLRPYAELKIFKAIEDQCKNSLQRIKWITLVNIALITCLRRGVLLKLKWGDIDWESRIIKVRKSCWGKGKRAPEKVPITTRLNVMLRRYHHALSDADKAPDMPLFESMRARYNRTNGKKPKRESWADKQFSQIIRRTDLWEPKKNDKDEVVYKNGKIVKLWFHFHNLRHTAQTRYESRPYLLSPEEYGYLMGHVVRKKKIQRTYSHGQDDLCDRIREAIEKGDKIIADGLKKPKGDVSSPYGIAFSGYLALGYREYLKTTETN